MPEMRSRQAEKNDLMFLLRSKGDEHRQGLQLRQRKVQGLQLRIKTRGGPSCFIQLIHIKV